jgi:hypothetical protein
MVLGQRFKMLILAPFSFLMLLLGVAVGLLHAETLQGLVLNTAVLIASLQCGYLLGLGVRQLPVLARARRVHAPPAVSSLSARRSAH